MNVRPGPPADRGARLGDGLFETVLLVAGHAPLLPAHLARMRRSALALGLPCPDDLSRRVAAAAATAWDQAARPARAALRVRLTAAGPRGLSRGTGGATVGCEVTSLAARPFGLPSPPVRALTVGAYRVDPAAAATGHKTLSWLGFVLARREAEQRGADVGVVTTVTGEVAEADFANLFAVAGDEVRTPPLAAGALPGITRGRALRAFAAAGRPVRDVPLAPDALAGAREVFLTSSLAGVTPVSSLDGTAYEAPGAVALWLAGCLESDRGPREDAGSPH